MRLTRPKIRIGIDIGSSSIKVVGILQHQGAYELLFSEFIELSEKYSLQRLSDLRDRHYTEPLINIAKKHKLNNKPVSICVNANGSIAHLIRFQVIPMESAFVSLVQDELERLAGSPIQDMSVSCHQCKSAKNTLEVVACGIPNPFLNRMKTILNEAGFRKIEGLELDIISLHNAFLALKGDSLFESLLLVSIGAQKTHCVAIVHGASPSFHSISIGTDTIIGRLTSEFAITWTEGAEILKGGSYPEADSAEDTEAIILKKSFDDFFNILFAGLTGCLDQIRKTTANPKVSKILLTGGFSLMPELPNKVETALDVSTDVWNPFMDCRTRIRNVDEGVRFGSAIGAAIGGMHWT